MIKPEIDRKKLYKKMLVWLRKSDRHSAFICWALAECTGRVYNMGDVSLKNECPEIYQQKPDACDTEINWFDMDLAGKTKRIDILIKAIKMVK